MRKTVLLPLIFLFTASLCAKEKYLIITTDKYYQSEALNNFVDYRSNNFDVVVAVNSDIGKQIDHFVNFINSQNPKYVLLIGNYQDFPAKTIPYSKPVESFNFWVVKQVDSLFYMQIPIGLFFVENEKELENIINKTIKFEQNLNEMPDKLYTHSGSIEILEPWPIEFNDEILEEMYNSFFKQNKYLHRHETSLDDTPNDAQSDVQAINNGVKYFLYHGHGNIQKFSFGMGVEGINFLTNDKFYPIVFSASCLTGTFTGGIDTMNAPCFATNMLVSENGAVAFIGAYNTSSKGQNPLLYGFCKYVNKLENERLGDVLLKAFNNLELPETVKKYYPHVMAYEYNRARLQFHLFGDPALRINIPGTNIKFDKIENEFQISPNPASEYIEIRKPSEGFKPSEGSAIKIYNSYGECVITVENRHACSLQRINISNLPIGLYFIQIGNYSQKFMVER